MKVDGGHTITKVRSLTDLESARIRESMDRLRGFSGHAMLGPLVDSLNQLTETLDEMLTITPDTLNHGAFRSRLNGRMSAALTSFSGFRAAIEQHVRRLALPTPSSAPDNFKTLYASHPSYRLVHMLRNLDQHRPPASSVLTISKDEDPATGDPRSRPTIDVLATVKRCADESSSANHRTQWEQCGALWVDQTEPVDARVVFRSAFNACETVLAAHLNEAEPWILRDVRFIAGLVGEVQPWGSAHAIRVERDEAKGLAHIEDVALSALTFGEAMATLDAARRILGKRSVAEDDPAPAPDDPGGDMEA
ncbi:hypothetical protein [uncultured Microbacterium sp.]|uniref:hypothetical protein n=1 Tax=uncultured Microbacterium sp. TaxID=191216 RepID=UPI0028D5DC7D|nr:hypothetical protein [uncultured Microbacterium sp.]